MKSKEIIRRIARRQSVPRIGFSFLAPHPNDIKSIRGGKLISRAELPPMDWCANEQVLSRVPGFNGEVAVDVFGNIMGRFNGKTKGECIKGFLQDGWHQLSEEHFPYLDQSYYEGIDTEALKNEEKYVMANMPVSIFSNFRDGRLMANALMDALLEQENASRLMNMLADIACEAIRSLAGKGVDGIFAGDDWGTQDRTFVSPDTFREVFFPVYKRVFDTAHECGLDTFMHSCGNVYGIMDHMIEAGVDVFQFDQPELAGSARLAREFGGRAAFWCPVDIQKVMPTGDRQLIEKTAGDMVDAFKAAGGCLIAKDYPSWGDIGIEPEWADWARKVMLANAEL